MATTLTDPGHSAVSVSGLQLKGNSRKKEKERTIVIEEKQPIADILVIIFKTPEIKRLSNNTMSTQPKR